MKFIATEMFEKRASGVAPVPTNWKNIGTHAAYGALPGALGGAALGAVGSLVTGDDHMGRDMMLGAGAGGLATAGRSAFKAHQGQTSSLAAAPYVMTHPSIAPEVNTHAPEAMAGRIGDYMNGKLTPPAPTV